MGDAQARATAKYAAKTYDRIQILVRKDTTYNRETLKQIAADRGMSLNEMFLTAVIKYIEET